jgi:hypothetical protein
MIAVAGRATSQLPRGDAMIVAGRLGLVISPVFFALAYVNYHQPNPLCTVPGDWGFLTSMWFMYLLMGIAHIGPWYRLALRTGRGA